MEIEWNENELKRKWDESENEIKMKMNDNKMHWKWKWTWNENVNEMKIQPKWNVHVIDQRTSSPFVFHLLSFVFWTMQNLNMFCKKGFFGKHVFSEVL